MSSSYSSSYSYFSSTAFFSSSSSSSLSPHNDQTAPHLIPIPIQSTSSASNATPIPVHYPHSILNSAATKIQSRYRSHLIRSLVRKILAVNSEAERLRRLIQRQETVDAVRGNERERLRVNEALMSLLLSLDSVPGHFDPNVRDLRRNVSRRIVGLQEILDGIVGERVDGGFEGLPGSWEEFLEKICAEEVREEKTEETREEKMRRMVAKCLEKYILGL